MDQSPAGKQDDQPIEPQPQEAEIPDDAYVYALERLLKGSKAKEVRKSLLDAGYNIQQAEKIIHYAATYKKQKAGLATEGDARSRGNTKTMIGLACVLFGLVITVGTYLTAQISGFYVVTTGLIVGGFIMCMRGHAESEGG